MFHLILRWLQLLEFLYMYFSDATRPDSQSSFYRFLYNEAHKIENVSIKYDQLSFFLFGQPPNADLTRKSDVALFWVLHC